MDANTFKTQIPTDLWYPSVIIPLSSSSGEEFFSQSFHIAYDYLNSYFEYQEHLSFCGIACISTLLKTLLPIQKWNQSLIYSTIAKDYMSNGITLINLAKILHLCGISSQIHYCQNYSYEKIFREDLLNENNFIIINYWRQYYIRDKDYIHQSGHFALIGGFNPKTDHVLILDPNNIRFPHHWLSLKDLVRMMCTEDKMASESRGYLIINHSKINKENHE
ncbi:hypothetical protein I4U23_027886 [Adineta vaga]|nr:hypothetical protein I4U23_027886 [Adineta vaga]